MIKENITVNIGGSYDFEGEIIVPSQVMTSNPQEESGDLTKTPNFVLKLVDEDKKIQINTYADVEFTLGDKTYTASMKAYNRAGNIIALQYVDGLTAEDVSDDSSDEPEEHTLEFNATDFYCSYDKYTESSQETGQLYIYYDGNAVQPTYDTLSSTTHTAVTIYTDGYATYRAKTNIEVGDYVDELTFTYEGLTATCNIHVSVTDSEPTQGLHFSSPADGDTITGALDYELQEFKYPIEVVGADGNNISYDITATSVTCDNQDVAVGYTEDADENEQSYISGVYLYIYNTGTGTATLTFDDGEQSCTATFTYEVTEAVEPTLDKYLDVECSLSSNSKSMALPQDNNNLQSYVYAAVYLVDPNTVVGEGTDWEHYYTQVVVTQHTLDMIGGESLGGWGWWGTKQYDDYLVVSDSSSVYALDENGNELGDFTEDVDRVGIWRNDQLGAWQSTIFDVHGMKLVVGNDEVYTKTFDLATPHLRVMRNGSQDNSGTFYGTVDQNTNETVWSDYLIYPVYDDMYGGIWNASNESDFIGQYGNGGTFVGQYLSGDPHGYQFMNNLGAFGLDPSAFEGQDTAEVLIEWRRSNPEAIPEYYEGAENEYPYKVLYSNTYNFSLQVPE